MKDWDSQPAPVGYVKALQSIDYAALYGRQNDDYRDLEARIARLNSLVLLLFVFNMITLALAFLALVLS